MACLRSIIGACGSRICIEKIREEMMVKGEFGILDVLWSFVLLIIVVVLMNQLWKFTLEIFQLMVSSPEVVFLFSLLQILRSI